MTDATDVRQDEAETAAPPAMDDGPAPGWIIGMLWTLALWALYYYFVAV